MSEAQAGCFVPVVAGNDEEKFAIMLGNYIGQLRCVDTDWYVYEPESGIWKHHRKEIFAPDALRLISSDLRKSRFAENVMNHLQKRSQVDAGHFCGAIKFTPQGAVLIAVRNGYLEISHRDIQMVDTDPDAGFTISLPVRYLPEARCPKFQEVLEQSVSDPVEREMILDAWATALIPDCRHEAALVAIGETGTGKSTVAAPLANIFGDAMSALSLSDLCDPRGYRLANLRWKAINLSSELNALEFEDSGLFKQLVSGEQFTARQIYGKPFEMRSHATLVFLANSLPRFKNGTQAEARRLRFIRFDNVPKVRDEGVKLYLEQSMDEAEGIFALLVERAWQLLKGRKLATGGEFSQLTAQRFQLNNDPIGGFVSMRCRMNRDAESSKDELFTAFEEFLRDHGLPESKLTREWFFRNLYDRFPGNLKDTRQRQGGSRIRAVAGIEVLE